MTVVAWTSTKRKIALGGRRKISVTALVSDSVGGIALQEGEWLNTEASKGQPTLSTDRGWKPFVLSTGAACGPVFPTLGKATEYAVQVASLTDWTQAPHEVPGPLYAKVMRLWYAAAGKKLTRAMRKELAELEAETKAAEVAHV